METFICIGLCCMGLALFFLRKYAGRKNKVKEPDFKFWWDDNKIDLLSSILAVAIVMTLMLLGSIQIDLEGLMKEYKVPFILILSAKPAVSAVIGYFGANWAYGKFSK